MNEPGIDTDVIIRLIIGDDPVKQAAAVALFRRIEAMDIVVHGPDTVIADAVFVLSSPRMYAMPRLEIRNVLAPLVRLPGFRLPNRRILLRALDSYATTRVDFGDAMIVAACERRGASVVYSYDHDFDRFPQMQRREP